MSVARKKLPRGSRSIIMAAAEAGQLRESEVCKAIGLRWRTWKRLLRDNQDAAEMLEEAKAVERDALLRVVYNQAHQGDTNAARFLLAAVHGVSDKGDGPAHPQQGGVVINLPSSLSPEDYSRLFHHPAPALANEREGLDDLEED